MSTGAPSASGTSTRPNVAGRPPSAAVTGAASSGDVVGDGRVDATVVVVDSAVWIVVAVVVVVVSPPGRALGSEPQAASKTTQTAAAHRPRR